MLGLIDLNLCISDPFCVKLFILLAQLSIHRLKTVLYEC